LEETATLLSRDVDDEVQTKQEDVKGKKEDEEDVDVMAPQVMLDENGDVVINQQRLVYSYKYYSGCSTKAKSSAEKVLAKVALIKSS